MNIARFVPKRTHAHDVRPRRRAGPAELDVLLVEDDAMCRDAMVTLLEIEGFRVTTAISGEGALALLLGGACAPRVILLDLVMPHMSGYALIDELRTRRTLGHIPVVLVSGRGDVEALSVELGVDGFLKKPPDADDVVAVVQRFTGDTRARV